MIPRFDSFRARVLAFILPLMVLVLGLTLVLTDAANTENARSLIQTQLDDEADRLTRSIEQRSRHMADATRLLTADFAFKRAHALGDVPTLRSAMANHLSRLEGGEMMVVLDLDGAPVAAVGPEPVMREAEAFAPLAEAARTDDYGEAAGILMLADVPYQMVVTPLLAPDPVAWVAVGFRLDDAFLRDFRAETEADLSLASPTDGEGFEIHASTLAPEQRTALAAAAASGSGIVDLTGDEVVLESRALTVLGGGELSVLLDRSLEAALAPYQAMRSVLLGLFLLALAVSVGGALLIARSVSRPVSELADAARAVQAGDLETRVPVHARDELGRLAERFNAMVEGLAERDRTRDLLGKVVSPQVAEELLGRELELGGEERRCTVLFSDIRGFTGLCEGRSPSQILDLLNAYFTEMTRVVDEHGGVVDKFIGDALMAVFGAPVQHEDEAARAVAAGLAMEAALARFNAARAGDRPLAIGIGLATGEVVAGNMGSEQRLNYTVIGDAVNIASRVEGLCKVYGVSLLCAESTLTASGHSPSVAVDRVTVAGRREPMAIHVPLTPDSPDAGRVEDFARALELEQGGAFEEALEAWRAIAAEGELTGPVALHRERCETFVALPPEHWDGVVAHGK